MEFSDIQPVSQSGHLQEQFSINSAADLSLIFNSRSNAGDQVEVFLSIAEGQPEVALGSFSTVVRNMTNPTIKALALQGFGKISQPYKQALASCASSESQELLKLLSNEVRSPTSDVTAWAAAEALKDVGFSLENIQHPQGGNLSEPPRRIQKEILDRKIQEINRIKRYNSRDEFTAEYERFLEFWIYGPTSEFFNENLTTPEHIDIIRDILHFTQIRGVQLGLNARSLKAQEESFVKAKSIFKQYSNSKENDFKRTLGNSLKRFLKEESTEVTDLQKLAKALIFNHQLGIEHDRSDFAKLTTSKIKTYILSLEQYCSQVSFIFASAISVSGEVNLNSLLKNDLNIYLEDAKKCIGQFKNQLNLIETEQSKIESNVILLGASFEDIRSIDYGFFNNYLNSLHKEYLELGVQPQTYEECQQFKNKLIAIKDKLLKEVRDRRNILSSLVSDLSTQGRKLTDNSNLERVKEESKGWIGWGIGLIIITYVISSSISSYSPSRGNVSNNRSEPAWYTVNYPKEECGHSSSSDNCWYPVFITYTNSNWSKIIENCRDVSKAQTQDIALEKAQIQVASFNNEAEAQGFADFMDQYYDGKPWVGQKKCY